MKRAENNAYLRSAARNFDRQMAWRLARTLGGQGLSVWRLEAIKAVIALSEERPGNLAALDAARLRSKVWQQIFFLISASVAACLFILWFLRFGLVGSAGGLPKGVSRLMAVHGELATRTRHMFTALPNADPPIEAILLLGRLRYLPRTLAQTLPDKLGLTSLPPLVLPLSPSAVLASMADWPQMLAEGLEQAATPPRVTSFRDAVGISFRVWLGCAQTHWWKQNGPDRCELVLGMTGTADTTLLERAVQESGGRTVHIVHGQATGPNFAGISDLALFRSGHDATAYSELGTYGRCEVQPADATDVKPRGYSGVLLITNLAHPMNVGYRLTGPADEIALIRCVGMATRLMGDRAQPLLWKPHPVIDQIADAEAIRRTAREEGFTELAADSAMAKAAANSRWVVSSPSTVALDLMQKGILCLLIDPQGSLTDTAIAALPTCPLNPDAIVTALVDYDNDEAYTEAFNLAFDQIQPAAPIALKWPRK